MMNYRLDFGFPYDDYNHFKSNEYGSNNNDIQNINDSFMSEPDYTNMDVYHLFSFEERNIELICFPYLLKSNIGRYNYSFNPNISVFLIL